MSKLLIVESPAKAKTIGKYLGSEYTVVASIGHVRDLPKSNKKAIDLDGFVPHYEISAGKEKVLDEIGLSAAVEWQAREFSRRTGIRCLAEIEPGFEDPDRERSTAVFRIMQELLTNVARHAQATRVDVRLSDGEIIKLSVQDNGRGIEKDKFQHARSLGFMGLRERVLAFGGSIEVEGKEGEGTKATVSIPNRVTQTVYQA